MPRYGGAAAVEWRRLTTAAVREYHSRFYMRWGGVGLR